MTSKRSQPGAPLCQAALIFLLTITPTVGWGQADAPTPLPLPPAAEEAVNKGILAARLPDYLLAIRFFEDARKIAPNAAVIYLNLGLAESRIPGRELRAIAWFGAYLAAYPGAPNAAAVKAEIALLEVRNQGNTSRLITAFQNVGDQLRDLDSDSRRRELAQLWAQSGDVAAAQRTADLVKDGYSRDVARREIASAQALAGDFSGALKTADLIEEDVLKQGIKSGAQVAIAMAQVQAGDLAGAETTLTSAQRTVDLILTASNKLLPQGEIDRALVRLAEARTPQPPTRPWSASDWLFHLDYKKSLNADPFLDMAGYLKSSPSRPLPEWFSDDVRSLPPDNPLRVYYSLKTTAELVVRTQNKITGMLKHEQKR